MIHQRRPLRAPRRHLVVARIQRALRPQRPHRDRIRRNPRRRHAPIHQLAVLGLTVVARRRHHHQPRTHRPLHRLADRIVPVTLRRRRAQRQVQYPDAERLPVLDREVDGLDHVARPAAAVRVQHLQVDQVRRRRHPALRALHRRLEAPRRDDARDVRAVAVEVGAGPVGVGEVDIRHHAVLERRVVRDAAVDNRHADAAAIHRPERLDRARPRRLRPRERRRHRHVRVHGRIARERVDFNVLRERVQPGPVNAEHRARRQHFLDAEAMTTREALDPVGRARHDHVDRGGRTRVEMTAEIGRHPRAMRSRVHRRDQRNRQQRGGNGNGGAVPCRS